MAKITRKARPQTRLARKRRAALSVWFEMIVGGKSHVQLHTENQQVGREITRFAWFIMCADVWRPGRVEIAKFARTKIRGLGFSRKPTTQEIWIRIEELGHSLCTLADGPALGVVFLDQPKGDACWIAMDQVTCQLNQSRDVFVLKRDKNGKRELNGQGCPPSKRWNLDDEIVFRLVS